MEQDQSKAIWCGPVCISWHPERRVVQFTSWRGNELTNTFSLHYHHLSLKCAPRAEPPGVLRVEAGEVPQKGVQGEDQRNQVQSGV